MSYSNQEVKVFKAFCDEHRLAILQLLQGGEKCACILIEALGMKQSALSYHMKILCESNVVTSRQEGKWTHYRLNPTGFDLAFDLLKEISTGHKSNEKNCCHSSS